MDYPKSVPSVGLVGGKFVDEDALAGTPGSLIPAQWGNAVTEELLNVLTAAGITADEFNNSQLLLAISRLKLISPAQYAVGTAAGNALSATYTPAVTALTDGMVLKCKSPFANTAAATFNPNGLGAKAIVGGGHSALQGGEIVANSELWLQYNSSIGAGSWVLVACSGGAFQVSPASKSQHAMQLGQAVGRLIGVQTFIANGTYTPTSGTTSVIVEAVGGGGSGGAAAATAAGQAAAGAGGGSGAYGRARFTAAFSGVAVTIGAGGAAPAAGANNGNPGGATSFGALLSCPGGTAGGGSATTAGVGATGAGGGNGATPSGANLVGFAGKGGANGLSIGSGQGVAGEGGSNPLGSGGHYPVGTGARSGSGYGAGSSGANNNQSLAASAGVAGQPGVVIVYEYA